VKKTSIYLDPDLDEALARRAAEEGLTKAEFIRRTLAGALSRPPRVKPEAIGIIKGGRTDVARNIDAYLESTGFGEWR
jgi:Ribbon-helix-helix protein, copG family